jgi:hypothetical protein
MEQNTNKNEQEKVKMTENANIMEEKEMSEKAQEQKEKVSKEESNMNVKNENEEKIKEDVDNMKLWNSVEKTDPRFTKFISYGSRRFTAISAYYQIKTATKQWGSYGSSWGLKNSELTIQTINNTEMAIYKAIFYYPNGEFEIRNSIKIADDEFLKKLETDTITKALSRLGFNADVFLGYFDDSRYIEKLKNELKQEKEQEKSVNPQPVSQKSTAVETVANSEPENSELENPVNANEYDDLLNVGVIVLRNGDILVAEGSTFDNKNILKARGFQWNGDMKKWVKKIA